MFADIEGETELRNIEFQILHRYDITLTDILFQYSHLVGEHNLCRQIIVGGNLCKRIILVAQGLIEVLTCLRDKVDDLLITHQTAQRQGVDEHSHGVADTKV